MSSSGFGEQVRRSGGVTQPSAPRAHASVSNQQSHLITKAIWWKVLWEPQWQMTTFRNSKTPVGAWPTFACVPLAVTSLATEPTAAPCSWLLQLPSVGLAPHSSKACRGLGGTPRCNWAR